MRPLLAQKFSPERWNGGTPVHVQPKFDGIRALYQDGVFQSRDQLPMAPALLKHLSEPLKAMFPDPQTILDGELYVHGWPLGRINGAVTPIRLEPNEDTLQVEYYIFDRVSFQLPFAERFASVHTTIFGMPHPQIHAATTVKTDSPIWADEFYARIVAEGFEGIMYRIGDCPYTYPGQEWNSQWNIPRGRLKLMADKANRTYHLLKRKDFQDDEFEIIGVEEGEGKRRGMVGAFICEILKPDKTPYYPCRVFKVGTGINDVDGIHWFENPPIGHKAKVKFRCYTAAGVPFNPSLITIL